MPDYIDQLFIRYRHKGLLIDANLLLLYVVGLYRPTYISQFKRTNAYTREDFKLLTRIMDYFGVVVTTPHVLTEVSNFLGQLSGRPQKACLAAFRILVPELIEEHHPAASLCEHPHFPQLRLIDTGIAEISAGTYLVLTADLPLYHMLAGTNQDALNFNQLRMASW